MGVTKIHNHNQHDIKAKTGIITLSSSRNETDDVSGKLIKELLEKQGHIVSNYQIIPDDKNKLIEILKFYESLDLIITTGGTGITNDDITTDVVSKLITKKLSSFEILFAKLSYDEIGSRALLSRALAGVLNKNIIFCLPGSSSAVRLAMEKLILPEIGHLMKHLRE